MTESCTAANPEQGLFLSAQTLKLRVVENSGGAPEACVVRGTPGQTRLGGCPQFPHRTPGDPPSTSRHGGARAGCRARAGRRSPASTSLQSAPACISARGGGVAGRSELEIAKRGKKRATPSSKSTPWMPNGARQERGLPRIRKSALRGEILVWRKGVWTSFLEVDREQFLAKRVGPRSEPAQGHFRPAPHGTFGTFACFAPPTSTSSPAVIRKSA